MASIGRWRRADPGSVRDFSLRPGLVRISRSRPAEESVTASDGRPRRQPIPERDPLVATTHQLDLRPVPPNVRCHSAWYFRSRLQSISVGMPLHASQNISTMIGVDATSKSVSVIAAWTIRPLRCPVVDPNRSIGALVRAQSLLLPWRSATTASTGKAP